MMGCQSGTPSSEANASSVDAVSAPVALVVAEPETANIPASEAAASDRQFTPRPVTSRPEAKKPVRKVVAAPAPKVEPETIYVETYGAQGKVWGHVTMTGDTGTGTIHDADENTLSVTCSRHGNELYAVDQNSRRYVFKLK